MEPVLTRSKGMHTEGPEPGPMLGLSKPPRVEGERMLPAGAGALGARAGVSSAAAPAAPASPSAGDQPSGDSASSGTLCLR